MAAGNQYFAPEANELGTQRFTQSGEAEGWYQFDRTGYTGDAINVVVPPEATGFLIQATTDVAYSFSPAASTIGSPFLTLAAGQSAFFSGRVHINQFSVFLSAGGDVDFIITFYTGNIGPIPTIFRVGGGGPTPPPGGGTVTSVNVSGGDTGLGATGGPITTAGAITLIGRARVDTANVVHVMKNGSDSGPRMGLPYRIDRPFLTCAAAEAAAAQGDTIMVWQGTFDEQDLGTKRLFYVLQGSTLTSTTGSVFTTVEDIDVSGSGLIQCELNEPAVRVVDSRTFRCIGIDITSEGDGVFIEASTLVSVCNIRAQANGIVTGIGATIQHRGSITAVAGSAAIYDQGSVSGSVQGDVTGIDCLAISHQAGTLKVYGSVTSVNTSAVALLAAAELDIHGPVSGSDIAVSSSELYAGTANIYGSVDAASSIALEGGQLNVHGNVTATTGRAADVSTNGKLRVIGNLSTEEGDAAVRNGGGQVHVVGNVTNNNGTDGNALFSLGGTTRVDGDLFNTGESVCMRADGGFVSINGDITAANVAGTGVRVLEGTTFVSGNISSQGDGWNQIGGTATHVGDTTSQTNAYAIAAGSLVHHGQGTSVNEYAMRVTGGSATNVGDLIGASPAAVRIDNGTLEQRGNVSAPASGTGVLMTGGDLQVYGNIISGTGQGLLVSGGISLAVYGNITGALNGFRAASVATTLRAYIFGSCTGVSGVSIQDSGALVAHINGPVIGLSAAGATVGLGTVYFSDLVLATTGSLPGIAISAAGANVRLLASARVEGTGANSITGPAASSITSFGASGDTAAQGTVTVNGTYTIIP